MPGKQKNRKPPWFAFYASSWNGSKAILLMEAVQHGYFINLLARAWDSDKPCYLPNDPEFLWRAARAKSREEFEIHSTLVLEQFAVRGSYMVNLRQLEELKRWHNSAAQKSLAGAIGAKARWHNKKRDAAAMRVPMADDAILEVEVDVEVEEPKKPPQQTPLLAAFIGKHLTVSQTQDHMLAAAFPWVESRAVEYAKFDSWCEANPARRPKKPSRAVHNWFTRIQQPRGSNGAGKTGYRDAEHRAKLAETDRAAENFLRRAGGMDAGMVAVLPAKTGTH